MFSPADVKLAGKLRKQGVLIPYRMMTAARGCGLPLSLAASVLIQESGGGVNEWGHDRGPDGQIIYPGIEGRLLVTRANVAAYLKHRGPGGEGGMQGCGVTQLTWYAFQDEATRRGGLWRPLVQMQVGFTDLAAGVRRSGLYAGVAAYNGTGAAAEAYARAVVERAGRIAAACGLPAIG
jgi:hypothetical protein